MYLNRILPCALLGALAACGPTPPAPDSGVEEVDAGVDAGVMLMRCAATPITCGDQSTMELDLRANASTLPITEEGSTSGFQTYVDARAGGLNPTMSYTYARFTETGLQKLDISDEQATTDTTWDIAFRRFVIRLNSGVSGPSCVQAARMPMGTMFDSVTTVDPALSFNVERYFTTSCGFIEDGSGLASPATVLSSFWRYSGCVAMTDNVFIIKLADGRHVKAQVLSYYDFAPQTTCNMTNAVPQPSGAAQIRLHWQFL